jgi:peptidoglycan hydrolase-like protein with peptidoglycan-binding domain
MKKGFDADRDLVPFGQCLLAEGYSFVCRYYNVNDPLKNLTYEEARFLSEIGLDIVAVWENGFPTDGSYFSEAKGFYDGLEAYQYASQMINQPPNTPIYFSVDYDALEEDVDGPVSSYFEGLAKAFNELGRNNPKYKIGVYGSGLVCGKIKGSGLASYSWLAQSTGWCESDIYNDYNIKQLAQQTECPGLGGIAGDPDESPNDAEGSFKVLT